MVPSNDCLLVAPGNAKVPDRIQEEFHPAHALVNRTSPFVSVRAALTTFLAGGVLIAGISHLYGWSISDGLIIYSALALPLLIACISSRVIAATVLVLFFVTVLLVLTRMISRGPPARTAH